MLCISINPPYIHVWNTVVTSGLVPVAATRNFWTSYKNQISGLLVLHLLLPLKAVVSLSLFYSIALVNVVQNWLNWFHFLFLARGRSNRYSDRLHNFSVTIPRFYKDAYVNSFFLCTARPWNSLPLECFLLTYDLNGFKSRNNRHLLTVGSM